MLALRLRFARTKKYQWALTICIKNPVFPVKCFEKKTKTFQGIINFSQFYWNDRKYPVPLLYVGYQCHASTRGNAKNFLFFFLRAQLNPTPILGAKTIPVIFVEKRFTEISSQMLKAIRRLKDISAKESRSYERSTYRTEIFFLLLTDLDLVEGKFSNLLKLDLSQPP